MKSIYLDLNLIDMKKNGWMIEAETLIENKFDERVSPISPLFEQSQNRGEQVKDN